MRLVENTKVVMRDAMVAAAAMSTATKSVNMSKYNRCRITLLVTTSSTAVDGTVTLFQGTTTTCSTALAFSEYWSAAAINGDTAGDDALVRTEASTLITAGASTATSMYVFEVNVSDLNTDTYGSENKYIRANVTAISNATHAALIYELYEPRIALGAEAMPSVNT